MCTGLAKGVGTMSDLRREQREAEYERDRMNYAGFSEEAVGSLSGRMSDWFEENGGTAMPGTVEVGSITRYHNSPEGQYVVYWTADHKHTQRLVQGRDTVSFGLDGDSQRVIDFKMVEA